MALKKIFSFANESIVIVYSKYYTDHLYYNRLQVCKEYLLLSTNTLDYLLIYLTILDKKKLMERNIPNNKSCDASLSAIIFDL